MKFPRRSLFSILVAVVMAVGALAVAPHAFAQVVDPTSGLATFAQEAGFSTSGSLTLTIARLIRTVLSMLGILAIVFILYGGFRYMTSGGSDDKVKSAKKIFSSAIIGLVIVLSAFAIVQFILGQLVGSLNGTGSSSNDGGNGGGYGDGGGTSSQFVLTDVNLECAYAIKNVNLQFTFSNNPSLESINNGGIRVQKSGTDVPGTFGVSGKVATFTPTQDCSADGFPTEHCYDAGADYTIELSTTLLKSSTDLAYRCDTTYPCSFDFTTGTAVDTEGPTTMELTAPEEGAAVYTNEIRSLQAYTVDDTGVSSLVFTIDNGDSIYDAALSTDSSVGSLSPENYFSTADGSEWYVSSSYATGTHTVRARGYDCAGHANTSSDVTVEVYPASCNDGITNNGEVEPGDCGGTSECGACDGSPCTSNADCSSGYCSGEIDPNTGLVIDGVCASVPEITAVSPGDGAVGNLISIKGRGFGTAAGTVTFLGGEGTADDVIVAGYQCDGGASPWSDREIIVQLTDAIADGPIRVTTALDATGNAYSDDTDDAFGATINDFAMNEVVRPGLCAIADNSGVGHSVVALSGNNFGVPQGTSTVYFDNYESSDYYSWSGEALSVQVPLLNARAYDTQVWVGDFVCATAQGVMTPETCATDADCTASSGETCATMRCAGSVSATCATSADCGTDGPCVSLRQGSNKVSYTVIDSETATTPVIASVASGWTACGNDGIHCATDAECASRNSGDTCQERDSWGPPGQYVTISGTGFGTQTGNVILTDATGTAYGTFEFPEACGGDTWDDAQITFKVPANYYSADGDALPVAFDTFSLAVRTVSGIVSNATDFSILSDAPGPGICNIDPSSGPASSASATVPGIDISGDNLGSARTGDADVTFSTNVSATTDGWTNASVSTATVPVGSATGPVYVTDSSGYRSNGMNFQVGSCSDGTISCGTGTSCCADGSCSVSCPAAIPPAHYSWAFSTGNIPATPRVDVFCQSGSGVSPGPWNSWSDSENICVNTSVTATFTVPMEPIALADVVVQACSGTDATDPCASLSATDLATGAVLGKIASTWTDGFLWEPTLSNGTSVTDFLPQTTYRVTLVASGIVSSEGAAMVHDYSWQFTTAKSTDPCLVGSVFTSPSAYTSRETTDDPDFSAMPISAGDICVPMACDANGLSWSWSSDDAAAASLNDQTHSGSICAKHADVLAETVSGDPVTLTATAVNPQGASPSDDAELTVNFADPSVSSWTPSCDTVCLNAAIGATFNTVMSDDFTTDTVKIYTCADSLCADNELTEWTTGRTVSHASGSDTVSIEHTTLFEANTWYRVVISGDVRSRSGVKLSVSGSNYPSENNQYFDGDFSWKFRSKDSTEACAVDRVTTSPAAATATVIGEEHLWQAIPFGAPDDCSVNGQQLDPTGYAWNPWTAVDANQAAHADGSNATDDVATMVTQGGATTPLLLTTSLADGCSTECLHAGSAATYDDPVCGDGRVTRTSDDGLSGGEECDGGTSCSASCLFVGNADPATCGNGIHEPSLGEECDDHDRSDANGCSSVCLNAGSAKAHTGCGDERIDQATNTGGEDCDDGNRANGDGCSSTCLDEGGIAVSGIYAVCGNSAVEAGEDCDVGDADDGDGCSSACLYEGAAICAYECTVSHDNCSGLGASCGSSGGACLPVVSPCVGDGRLDYSAVPGAWSSRSEDCDDANATNGDGCSASGLNEGSSLDYSVPSYCGDGAATGIGEECDAASGAASSDAHFGYWGVSHVTAAAASDVVDGSASATITATENASGEKGEGTLTLSCSCTNDNACGSTGQYGCGTSSCCFVRPEVVGQYPENGATDVCLNTALSVDFSDVMDKASFSTWADANSDGVFDYGEGHQNLYLELTSLGGSSVDASNCPSSYVPSYLAFSSDAEGRSWIARAWSWIVTSVRGLFAGTARADNTDKTFACLTPVSYALTTETMSDSSVGSRVALGLTDTLQPSSTYRLVVVEDADPTNAPDSISGVLSANAVSVDFSGDGTATSSGAEGAGKDVRATFTTGTEVCTLDAVTVEDLGAVESLVSGSVADPSVGYFTSTGEQHSVAASAFTVRSGQKEAVQETTAYGWSWGWGTTVSDALENGTNVVSVPATVLPTTDVPASTATAAGVTGTESVVATASFNAANTFGAATGGVSGTLLLTANVCDNPPTVGFPYADSISNFTFFYCRDYGVAGDASDDLPDFEEGAAPIDVTSYAGSGILQELIFKIAGTSDAIGVRVLPNPTYLTPSAWYDAKGFTGSPSNATVDGYQAVTDGNTTYVAAANVNAGTVYPNVYAISYTKNADAKSQEIFRQILANWSFNANVDAVTDVNLCQATSANCASADVSRCSVVSATPCLGLTDTATCAATQACVQASAGTYYCANVSLSSCSDDASCANPRLSCAVVRNATSCSPDSSYPVDASTGSFVTCDWDGDCGNTCETVGSTTACSLTGTACATDADCEHASCDGSKAKLTRDLRRLEDVTSIAGALDAYGAANGFCSVTTNQSCMSDSSCPGTETCEPSVPKLADGTFVSSYSVSTWPSWTAGLGNALGTSLPTDPVNEFRNCDGENYESATCWNSVAATFVCPDESQVYGYRSLGGTSFELNAELEFDSAAWAYALSPSTLGTVTAEYDYNGRRALKDNFSATELFCNDVTLGTSAVCGDGVVNTDTESGSFEACEYGDVSSVSCTDATTGTVGTMTVTCLNGSNGTGAACSGYQTEADATDVGATCVPFSCGNGAVEEGEDCDDGSQNGSYGHCGDDCSTDTAFYCGDGYLAGGEQCDCGEATNFASLVKRGADTSADYDENSWAYLNNCQASNGQWKRNPAGTCAYDCSSPGPSCGDWEVNGSEICDGGYETSSGTLCADGTECSTTADCSDGSTCGATYPACGSGTVCSGATDVGADCDAAGDGTDCQSGSCNASGKCEDAGDTGAKCSDGFRSDDGVTACELGCGTVTYDLQRTRTCVTTGTAMCTWSIADGDPGWTACVSAEYCGNGVKDGTEECDDGNDGNDDACTNSCVSNVCGDGYVYSGVESCDDASGNGTACDASYESTCHYCTASCQYKTRSGEYCGNGTIDGSEYCDGASVPYACYDDSPGVASAVTAASCDATNEGTSTGCSDGFTCRWIGVCNGGTKNGELCTLDPSSTESGGTYHTDTTADAYGNLTLDQNGCGSDGECVAPTCASDCGSSCPTAFETVSVLATTEEVGAVGSDSIELFSYGNVDGDSPDNASLSLPACTVGTRVTADINTANVVPPSVDIVFVTDYTKTMGYFVDGALYEDANPVDGYGDDADGNGIGDTSCATASATCVRYAPTGSTRIDYVKAATEDAISAIFSTLSEAGAAVRGATVSFYDGVSTDVGFHVDNDSGALTDDESELETAIEAYGSTYSDLRINTPHFKGLNGAIQTLADSTADEKIIVFLSDGLPNINADGGTCTSTKDCIVEAEGLILPLLNTTSGIPSIKVFTAAITSTDSAKGYMAHLSTDTCADERYGSLSDCDPTNNVEYAYQAEDAAGITTMYDAIVASILNVTVGLTTSVTTTTSVENGHNKVLPFPTDFECTGESLAIPMTVSYSGSGPITMSNIQFQYCPAQ